MPPILFPAKLKPGDEIQIIAPSSSLGIIPQTLIDRAVNHLRNMGLVVSFSKHSNQKNGFNSSAISYRVSDLHDAFLNPNIRGIFAAEGGFNSNQLLGHIDWKIVRNHPKIFCGYSDIAAVLNAIFLKTGLVTYHGPDLSTIGLFQPQDYAFLHFKKCLFEKAPYALFPSDRWKDVWGGKGWPNPDTPIPSFKTEWVALREGEAEGTMIGGNLSTLNLLQGTDFWPGLKNTILMIEDDHESYPQIFDRQLQSLIHQKDFRHVRGIVIGRFMKGSRMTKTTLGEIMTSKPELNSIPVIAHADFGHTYPAFTFPIGGRARLKVAPDRIDLNILRH